MSAEISALYGRLYGGLERLGPGLARDVEQCLVRAEVGPRARILDAGCGTGADTKTLLKLRPQSQIVAVDTNAAFLSELQAHEAQTPHLTVTCGNMLEVAGPWDFIWSAGALYIPGVSNALNGLRDRLAPGACIAFSHLCWFTETPSEAARVFWDTNYAALRGQEALCAEIEAAGYRVLDQKRLGDGAWEAFFTPLEARCDRLDATTNLAPKLREMVAQTREEIAVWRAHRREFGYVLNLVTPK